MLISLYTISFLLTFSPLLSPLTMFSMRGCMSYSAFWDRSWRGLMRAPCTLRRKSMGGIPILRSSDPLAYRQYPARAPPVLDHASHSTARSVRWLPSMERDTTAVLWLGNNDRSLSLQVRAAGQEFVGCNPNASANRV